MRLQIQTVRRVCLCSLLIGLTGVATGRAEVSAPGKSPAAGSADKPAPEPVDEDLQAIQQRLKATRLRPVALDRSGNPRIEFNDVPFAWQDLNHPQLAKMVSDYQLDDVIGAGNDEFEQLLLLRHWVHVNIPRGNPEWNPDQPWLLADLARNGRAFYCTHYANVLMYAATALGWPARHLGVDCDHDEGQRSTHHGVTEVFCYELDKWVVLDAMFDLHFESDGLPLSAMEIRGALQRDRLDIDRVVGPSRMKTATRKNVAPDGFDHAGCYFWFHIPTRNNYFSQPSWQGNERYVLYIDDANRAKTWYQNQYGPDGGFAGSRLHTGYRTGKFLKTERLADVYPELGRTHIDFDLALPRGKKTAVLPVVLYTINPHWKGFEVRFDGEGPWVPISRRVDWRLHAGRNVMEARLITQSHRRGKPARMELMLEDTEHPAQPSHAPQ